MNPEIIAKLIELFNKPIHCFIIGIVFLRYGILPWLGWILILIAITEGIITITKYLYKIVQKYKRKQNIIKQYEDLNETDKKIIDICCYTKGGEADNVDIYKTLNIDIIHLINNYYKRLENEGFFALHTRPRMTKEYFDILKPYINKKRRQK